MERPQGPQLGVGHHPTTDPHGGPWDSKQGRGQGLEPSNFDKECLCDSLLPIKLGSLTWAHR